MPNQLHPMLNAFESRRARYILILTPNGTSSTHLFFGILPRDCRRVREKFAAGIIFFQAFATPGILGTGVRTVFSISVRQFSRENAEKRRSVRSLRATDRH